MNIVVICHYFPPVNSSGAKRFQFMTQYWLEANVNVTVITTKKSGADGEFTENIAPNLELIELNSLGKESQSSQGRAQFVPLYSSKFSLKRKVKDLVFQVFGQIPDPRLPFAFSFLSPFLSRKVVKALAGADVVICTSPPWSMLLAGLFVKQRFKKRLIVDHRDQFSNCHEMPGSWLAKKLEYTLDVFINRIADHVVTISTPMKEYYEKITSKPVSMIPNGFDDFSLRKAYENTKNSAKEGPITLRYMGIVSEGRIPRNLLAALNKLEKRGLSGNFRLEFYGNADLLQRFVEQNQPSLSHLFNYYDFVPYSKSLELILSADILIFAETSQINTSSAKGILTTKLFEYLGANVPIVADIQTNTLAGQMILKYSDNSIVSTDQETLETYLASFIRPANPRELNDKMSQYSRKEASKKYLSIIRSNKRVVSNL